MTTYSSLKYDHPFSSNATGTGSLTLISSQTASASASISFTTGIDSTYDEYIFKFINLHPSVDQAKTRIDFSTDGGSTYSVTKTTSFFFANNNEAGTGDVSLEYDTGVDLAQSTNPQLLQQFGVGADNDECTVGIIHLFQPSSTTYVKHFLGVARGIGYVADRYSTTNYFAGYCNTTSAINAVKFDFASGNIDDGTILMYGVK